MDKFNIPRAHDFTAENDLCDKVTKANFFGKGNVKLTDEEILY